VKDLEILLLRRPLGIVDRARVEKLTLAVLAAHLPSVTGWPMKQLGKVLRIFQPENCFQMAP